MKLNELSEEPLVLPPSELLITQSGHQIISSISNKEDPIKDKGKKIATKENNPLKCSKTSEGWCKEQMQESLEESIWIQELNHNTNRTLGICPFSKKESYMISILLEAKDGEFAEKPGPSSTKGEKVSETEETPLNKDNRHPPRSESPLRSRSKSKSSFGTNDDEEEESFTNESPMSHPRRTLSSPKKTPPPQSAKKPLSKASDSRTIIVQ
ncbi:unnamed protein product [Lactuca saligna]|uniref:Uncharacterized protein n=1 Tax=Lactuca saligna TaxID=75948 RepID=A0AA35YAB1_LACSI|nr:unnamed protein product [Lactuca saligna]